MLVEIFLNSDEDKKDFEMFSRKVNRRAERSEVWDQVDKPLRDKFVNFPSLNAKDQDWHGQLEWCKDVLLPRVLELQEMNKKFETYTLMMGVEHEDVKPFKEEINTLWKRRLSIWGLNPEMYQPPYVESGGKIKEIDKFFRLKKNRKQYGVSKAPEKEVTRKED